MLRNGMSLAESCISFYLAFLSSENIQSVCTPGWYRIEKLDSRGKRNWKKCQLNAANEWAAVNGIVWHPKQPSSSIFLVGVDEPESLKSRKKLFCPFSFPFFGCARYYRACVRVCVRVFGCVCVPAWVNVCKKRFWPVWRCLRFYFRSLNFRSVFHSQTRQTVCSVL